MASGGGLVPLSAVVLGVTGSTGRCVVSELLKLKDSVGRVTLLTRRKLTLPEHFGVDMAAEEEGGRLVQHVEDLDAISDDTVKQLCTGAHTFFNCLGTTRAVAGSAEAFRHIDMEIPLRMIRLAKEVGVAHCSCLTSTGSKSNSWLLYLRTKGQLEDSIRELNFPYTSLFRPGLLDRRSPDVPARFVEKMSMLFISGMPVGMVAEAMVKDALQFHQTPGAASTELVANNQEIRRICQAQSMPQTESGQTPAEESGQTPVEEVAQTPAEESGQTPAEEVAQMPAEEVAQTPAEESGQTPAKEVAQTPAEESAQKPADESAQQASEAPADESESGQTAADESGQTAAEESADTPAVKSD